MRLVRNIATIIIITIISIIGIPTVFAFENDIGYSKIHPASPLYFLKAIRENIEMALAQTQHVKTLREIEFATRRLREVNSLTATNHQDLIVSNLERFMANLNQLIGQAMLTDENTAISLTVASKAQMSFLQDIYEQISLPQAKRAVRSTINRLWQWQEKLAEKLNLVSQPKLAGEVLESKMSACQFLLKESSSSSISQTEKIVLEGRAKKCLRTN